jgi:NADPH:quinone reductase-like Zn-dependent oxidoreductase
MTSTATATTTIPALVPAPAGSGRLVDSAAVPAPQPAAGEALLAVEAFSINRGEVFLLEAPRAGWRPGQDVAGRVLRAAADGSGPPAGARVVAHAPQDGWAAQVAVASDRLAELPDAVSAEQAATLGVAGLTALRLLREAGALGGRRVLLTGASGGVGHFVVELAAAQGALVTAVSASPERGARLLELGAAEVVARVEDAAGPFDVVLESVGGPSLAAALQLAAPGAIVLWFGQAGGEPVTLDFFATVAAAPYARIVPFSYWRTGTSEADDLATLVRLVAGGRLHPEIGVVADWAGTDAQLAALRDRRLRGNAVLTISDR